MSRPVLDLDANLADADWTKGTWDLTGIDSLPKLTAYLQATGTPVEQFMALPVYYRNLEKLPWLKQLHSNAAHVLKWDEAKHVREPSGSDKGGQFAERTAGRGSTPETAQGVDTGGRGVSHPRPQEGAAHVRAGAQAYNDTHGLGPLTEGVYVPVDEARARRIADAYIQLPVLDTGPETMAAYHALGQEIQAQWDHAEQQMGITFEAWTKDGQPYANSKEMLADVAANKHLYFFTGGEAHPLLGEPDAHGLTLNDKFRAIHDLYGHASEGYAFGPRGEENAWLKHSQMFSSQAQRALTSETRGQNSWVNFGPHNYHADGTPKNIPPQDRPFAPQKAAILPEWASEWRQTYGSVLKWDESKHPRNPSGSSSGGEFASSAQGRLGFGSTDVHGEQVRPKVKSIAERLLEEPDRYDFENVKHVEAVLKDPSAKVHTVEDLEGSCNQVQVVEIEDAHGESIKGIFKPIAGEHWTYGEAGFNDADSEDPDADQIDPDTPVRHSISNKQFSFAEREVAAYELDQLLGTNVVPPTVLRKVNGHLGSVQAFVDKCTWNDSVDVEPDSVYGMSVLDYAIGNTDRHPQNYLIDINDRLVAIDQGMGFPHDHTEFREEVTLSKAWAKHFYKVTPETIDRIQSAVLETDWNEFASRHKMSVGEKESFLSRMNHLALIVEDGPPALRPVLQDMMRHSEFGG